jgi:hypothetical protein
MVMSKYSLRQSINSSMRTTNLDAYFNRLAEAQQKIKKQVKNKNDEKKNSI